MGEAFDKGALQSVLKGWLQGAMAVFGEECGQSRAVLVR